MIGTVKCAPGNQHNIDLKIINNQSNNTHIIRKTTESIMKVSRFDIRSYMYNLRTAAIIS